MFGVSGNKHEKKFEDAFSKELYLVFNKKMFGKYRVFFTFLGCLSIAGNQAYPNPPWKR